jgi:biopolymer transport protein ExbB
MIETFQSITLFGTGDPKLMSGGISQALVTTELGLAVAIPLLLIHSGLSSKSNRLVQILDEESAAIVARNAEKQHGNTD